MILLAYIGRVQVRKSIIDIMGMDLVSAVLLIFGYRSN
jgi:hypothetical protein